MAEESQFCISDHILWSDDAILIINKPSGLLTIRDGYNPDLPYLIKILSKEFGQLWVVHRLDRDTSGILIVARTAQAHQNLNLQFEHRLIKKTYHAITVGVPDRDHFIVDVPLRVNGDRHHRTIADPQKGKNAATEFVVLAKYKDFCLIEAHPSTGYTHQIRAHLLASGYPILSDPLYQGRPEKGAKLPFSKVSQLDNSLISRTALHAFSITFSHPLTGLITEKHATYPEDFDHAIKRLSQFAE